MNLAPTSVPESPAPAAPPRKIWRVGTLAYTSGGLVILFSWLLAGDFSWALKDRSVMWVVQVLIKKFEASDMIAGLLIGTLPNALGLILTPVVGYLSDRHRGRWGRRIPFLLIPTPFAALAMVGLAYSPALGGFLHGVLGQSSPGLNPTILGVVAVFWTIFEVATVIANAVFFALINDVVPKEMLGRFYGMFRALGLIAAMIFNYWLLGLAEAHYTAIFIAIGAIYGVGFTLMCWKVKEGEYPPPPVAPSRTDGGRRAAVVTYFRECFSNPYYVWIYVSTTLSWMAILTINLFNLFFAKSVAMDTATYGKYLAATFLISFCLSYFLGMLADKFHPLRLCLIGMAIYAAVTLAGGLFARDAQSFGIALVAYGVVSGTWQTMTASLSMRLFPRSRFAQFESARGLVSGLGMMIVGPLVGRLLDRTGHHYQYAYFASAGMALLALLSGWVVLRKFNRLGGTVNYVAPER